MDAHGPRASRGALSILVDFAWWGYGVRTTYYVRFWVFLLPHAGAGACGALGFCMEVGKTPRDMARPEVWAGALDESDSLRPLTTPLAAPQAPQGKLFFKKA